DPADAELGLPAGDNGRGHDLDRARQDRDVKALILVVALVEGGEVTRELGLREPLQLEPERLERGARRRSASPARTRREHEQEDEHRDDAGVAHGAPQSYG